MSKINVNTFKRLFEKIFTWGFLGYFTWVFLNLVFKNSNDLVKYNMKKIVPVSIVIAISMFLLLRLINRIAVKNNFINRHKKILLILSFIIIFFVQVFLAKQIYYLVGWDAGGLIVNAKALVENVDSFDISYFLLYPNNIFLLWIEKNIYLLSTLFNSISYEFLLVIINIIMIDIAVLLTLLLAKKIFNNKVMIISYYFSILIILFSPWIVICYTDSFCMLFPVLNIYLYFKIKESNNMKSKCILAIAMGIFTIIGYQIKPTAVISLIAIFISAVIYSIKDKKSFIMCVCLSLCVIGSGVVTKVICNKTIYSMEVKGVKLNSNEDMQVPMTHFLMMGLNTREIEDRGTLYGAWRQEDCDITFSCKTKDEKIKTNLNEYINRVKNLGAGGYLDYLSKKGNWMLSDGTFYYGGEGVFQASEPYTNSNLAKKFQSYYLFNGENYKVVANFMQAVWCLIIFFISLPLIYKEKNYESEALFLVRLTITGITIFLLFFEGRSRYFLNHLPLFIILASYGVYSMYDFLINLNKKK